ncbi:MAG TPA: hypothetical protein VFA76_04345 [Terriglobales bacterium]|nr:hypothetical protein [Terriglobales bacterium]
MILPFAWSKVVVKEIAGVHQAIHVRSKEGPSYTISRQFRDKVRQPELEKAKEQFLKWHERQTIVHVCFAHAFYAFTFAGKIVEGAEPWVIKPLNQTSVLVVSFDSIICRVRMDAPRSVRLARLPTETTIDVSEEHIQPSALALVGALVMIAFGRRTMREEALHRKLAGLKNQQDTSCARIQDNERAASRKLVVHPAAKQPWSGWWRIERSRMLSNLHT